MAIILANDGIESSAQKELEALGHTVDTTHYDGEDLLKRLAEVDVCIVRSATKIRAEQLDAGKKGNLKLVIRAGVGIDNIDVAHAEQIGVDVTNTPTASSDAVAELALGHMFALCRNIGAANVTMRKGQWLKKNYKGTEINGKTLGLLGFGRIARSLAKKAQALGMTVIYTNRSGAKADAPEFKYVDMDTLLKESDFISCHLPFSGGQALIGKAEIEKMKDGAFIVNTARGGVVDEDALVDAVESGKLGGAAVDVFVKEPNENERLYTNDKISMTPHIGAQTAEAQERIGANIVEIIKERF
ncbi:D-2-hydroxyacid dehydrogenase [Guggenheimella bovis]